MTRAADWLGVRLQSAAGRDVTLVQSSTTLSITAWHAMHEYEVVDSESMQTRVTSYDWTIAAEDVSAITLRPGARITDGAAVYEAMGIGKRPCVENLDSSGVLLLLHTKRVT